MRFQLRRCKQCYHYTMKDNCPDCDGVTVSVHPAKFSPDDKYMKYRMSEKYQ